MKKTLFSWFRTIAFWEGVSFLLLLFIAMPLKYMAGKPEYVRYSGMVHGVLFTAYLILAFLVKEKYNRNFMWLMIVFIISLLPFGTFFYEKKWNREEAEWLAARS